MLVFICCKILLSRMHSLLEVSQSYHRQKYQKYKIFIPFISKAPVTRILQWQVESATKLSYSHSPEAEVIDRGRTCSPAWGQHAKAQPRTPKYFPEQIVLFCISSKVQLWHFSGRTIFNVLACMASRESRGEDLGDALRLVGVWSVHGRSGAAETGGHSGGCSPALPGSLTVSPCQPNRQVPSSCRPLLFTSTFLKTEKQSSMSTGGPQVEFRHLDRWT